MPESNWIKQCWIETCQFAPPAWMRGLLVPAMLLASIPVAVGQSAMRAGGEGVVTTGTGVVELEPQRLRLNMWIQAQGKDAKSAVQSLSAHKDRVQKALEEMNADTETIRFSATRLSTGDDQPQEMRAAAQMMRQQLGGPALDPADMPTVYTAKAAVQVEWPLPTSDRDALALLPQGLLDQIENRDLAGKENKADLPEEQQEQLEEMESMMQESFGGFSVSSETDSGPKILFVAEVDRQQRIDATKQAFERARESAKLIAEASGLELGSLKSVAAAPDAANIRSIQYAWSQDEDGNPFETVDQSSVTASSLDGLQYTVSLTAVYEL